MWTYVGAFVLATLVAAGLVPLVVRFAYVIRAVDYPGEARKIHTRPIPRIGGLAVTAGFFAPIIALAIYRNDISNLIYADIRLTLALMVGALSVVALGVYDDIHGAAAKLKLIVQAIVAVGLWAAGFRIDLLGIPLGGAAELGWLSLPLTVLWIVGVTNALNLIDGLDGLAAGVALFATLVLFGVAFVDNAVLLCVLTAALGGALLGFLFFNFNPARIFLGDSGSMFLGFILSTVSIWTQRKGATAAALIVPVMALGLPILDTTLSVVRRVGQGKNPFQADRDHLHHRLLALGLSHRGAVLTLYTASGVFALGALVMLANDTTHRAIALSTVGVVVFILVRKVGVFSVPSANRPVELKLGECRDEIRAAGRDIRNAESADEVWARLIRVAPRLGVEELRLAAREPGAEAAREVVTHWRPEETGEGAWKLDRPLGPYDMARSLSLADAGHDYGELRVLFRRGVASSAELDTNLELLREALIDFSANRHFGQAAARPDTPRVVPILRSAPISRTAG